MRLVRIILLQLTLILGIATIAVAQQVRFDAAVPQVVEAGDPFRVEFTLNQKPSDFTPPAFSGVDVIAGPTVSQGQSVTIVNGKTTSSFSYTYTYLLQASSVGYVTIPPAKVVVDGSTYATRATKIEVVGQAPTQQGGGSQGGGSNQGESSAGGQSVKPATTIASDDIVLRVITNSTNVYKGQPIKVSFKLYTRVPLSGVESAKYPAFNGFWNQELNVDANPWQRETYNNKVYDAKVIREFLLFPQQTGVLQIEQLSLTLVAQIVTQSRRQSLFDDFFGGGASVQDVRKTLSTKPLNITVKNLPAGAPAGFSGAVGNFTMSGGVTPTDITANSAVNYTIKISGTGNLPLVTTPTIEMPGSFEQYTVKTTDNYSSNGTTIAGSKEFEIPFIARAEGKYTIPAVEFSYFDPQTARYVTLKTNETNINVASDPTGGKGNPGLVSGVSKEDLKILGKDIRFIRVGSPQLSATGSFVIWSWYYILIILLLIALFVVTLIYMQKRIKLYSNTTLVKNKKAHKVALKRLKAAEKNMLAANEHQFYEEMLKGLWGYMSDKLSIPMADLSKENVRERLLRKNIDETLISAYEDIINNCEFARYAPSAATSMKDVYGAAVDLISKLESKI